MVVREYQEGKLGEYCRHNEPLVQTFEPPNADEKATKCGVVNIKEQHLEHWNQLLSEFYETNCDDKIIQWTYENCIYGIDY